MTVAQDRQADIVEMLLDDHRTVELLFGAFDENMAIKERDDLFRRLTMALVQHEVAEEETVYPVLRSMGPEMATEVGARIGEQAEAEELLRSMEQIDVMSEDFEEALRELHDSVLHHAKLEESEVFPCLVDAISPADRSEMGLRYTRARNRAPTHPHPHAPDTPPGNRIAASVAALVDRVRDAFRSVPGAGGINSDR